MTLKAPIEVRSFKRSIVTVHTSIASDVSTADFVGVAPKILDVADRIIKRAFVDQQGLDLRDLNRARNGLKEPEPELTAVNMVGATR